MKAKYVDHMGSDLSVVNAARVSYSKKSDWEITMPKNLLRNQYPIKRLTNADNNLIKFLARGCESRDWDNLLKEMLDCEDYEDLELAAQFIKTLPPHWSPFGHTAITIHVEAPIFVARQLGKHQVGFVWNEVSRRYIQTAPKFFMPENFRKAHKTSKQGSGEPLPQGKNLLMHGHASEVNATALNAYNAMLDSGVCPEQARMVLPQSMYTEWYWTGNLFGFANMYLQRTDSHVQGETRELAYDIGAIIRPLFPVSWAALTGEK